MSQTQAEIEYFSRRPRRNRDWEDENGRIVVLIPKFGNHFFGKWMMAKMNRPFYRLKLDEIGSFVWQRCDGATDIKQIGEQLAAHFGDKVEPVHERLGLFLRSLERSKSITYV